MLMYYMLLVRRIGLLVALTICWCCCCSSSLTACCLQKYISSTTNNYQVWDFWEVDAIIFTDTWGRYFVGMVTFQKGTYLGQLLLLCCDCCWRWWWCFFIGDAPYLLLLLLLLLLLCCFVDLVLKSYHYAWGILRLMTLRYKKGSLLLRTCNALWKVKAKNIYRVRFKVCWKVKVMRAVVSQIPRKNLLSWNRHMRSAIRQQLTTKDKINYATTLIFISIT